MSLKYRDNNGNEVPISGLNGQNGSLVPSVALQQSGTVTFSCEANSWTTVDVTFATPMPDTDYLVVTDSGETVYVHVQNATSKRTTGFTMIVWNRDAVSNTGIIRWTAFKLMTDTVHEADSAHISQNTANFAPAFNEVTSYAVGDYCTYNNVLYRCTTAHTAGVWAAGHFTAVTVGGELTSDCQDITSQITFNDNNLERPTYFSISVLKKGKVVEVSIFWFKPKVTTNGRILLSGLPIPKSSTRLQILAFSGLPAGETDTSDRERGTYGILEIDSQGRLTTGWGFMNTASSYNTHFTYMCQ